MDNQQSIEQLKNLKEYIKPKIRGKADDWHLDSLALEVAIEALEKQIPKGTEYHYSNGVEYYSCSTCGRVYWEIKFVPEYCSSCGQKLIIL